MYVPAQFREDRVEVLHALIEAHPFATLIVQTDAGLSVNHLPLVLDRPDVSPHSISSTPARALHGHVARANRVWREARIDADAVAIFHGPHGYISPAWYPSKAENERVVPTWNYVAAHVHGRLRFIEDATWLHRHVSALTRRHETDRAQPWDVTDAPPGFIQGLLGGIVGIELSIARIDGKWKLSQNRSDADRGGAIAGLRAEGSQAADQLAALMEEAARAATTDGSE